MLRPSKIVCVGRNYLDHAKEMGNEVPTQPLLFLKPVSAIIGDGDTITIPAGYGRVDFEGEIGVVVGKHLQHATADYCAKAVRGIVAINDVSGRDLQKSEPQWVRAKGTDTFCPVGAEKQGTPDLRDLTVITRHNGVERQRGHSRDMAFPIAELLAYISRWVTLEPGDLVATGTPAGVQQLADGDDVEVEIVGWSRVKNRVAVRS
jgi:2-keto-4-pentenoate hydratase/2-oxohepta-3-ene-1,7-dioic acid hydratase in catechol pathway